MPNHWEVLIGGRVKVSNTPEELGQNACDYFKWCEDNPIIVKNVVMSGTSAGKMVDMEKPRVYTVRGLCLHCGITEEWLRDVRRSKDESNPMFAIVSKILYVIYVQNIEYAMVDSFNPILTSKIWNMDKQDEGDTRVPKVNLVGGLPPLSNSENEILENIENEKLDIKISENEKLER